MARRRMTETLPKGTQIGDMMADEASITKVMDEVRKVKRKFKKYKNWKWEFTRYHGTKSTPEYQRAAREEWGEGYTKMRMAVRFGWYNPLWGISDYGAFYWTLGDDLSEFKKAYTMDSSQTATIRNTLKEVLARPLKQLSGYQRREGFLFD